MQLFLYDRKVFRRTFVYPTVLICYTLWFATFSLWALCRVFLRAINYPLPLILFLALICFGLTTVLVVYFLRVVYRQSAMRMLEHNNQVYEYIIASCKERYNIVVERQDVYNMLLTSHRDTFTATGKHLGLRIDPFGGFELIDLETGFECD